MELLFGLGLRSFSLQWATVRRKLVRVLGMSDCCVLCPQEDIKITSSKAQGTIVDEGVERTWGPEDWEEGKEDFFWMRHNCCTQI